MAVGPPEDCKSSDFSPRLPGEGLSACVFPHCHPFSLPSHRPFAGTSGPPCLPSDLPLVLPHPDPGPTLRIGLHVSPPHLMQCSLPALPKMTHLCQVNCSSWYLHSEVSRANRAIQNIIGGWGRELYRLYICNYCYCCIIVILNVFTQTSSLKS